MTPTATLHVTHPLALGVLAAVIAVARRCGRVGRPVVVRAMRLVDHCVWTEYAGT